MASLVRRSFPRPLPPDAEIVTRKRQGKHWPFLRLRENGKTVFYPLNKCRDAYLVPAAKWYGKYTDENGMPQRVPLSANKAAAQQMLAELVKQVERRKAGLSHPSDEHASRPLAEHLDDYTAAKRALGIPEEQVRQTVTRVRAVLEGCRFTFPRDIGAEAVLEFLAELRHDRPSPPLPEQDWFTPAEIAQLASVGRAAVTAMIRRHGLRDVAMGRGRARRFPRAIVLQLLERHCLGLGSQTVSYYWREFGSFCRWLASPRQKRLAENPLAGVPGPAPRSDPRHDRRAFSLEELYRLLEAARSSAFIWRGMTGEDRHFLYLTACATGFRRKELSALMPANFDLAGEVPTACLSGKRTKNKRHAAQPLPDDVAEALRGYLAGRPADRPIWPRLKEVIIALRADLEAAGIPYVVDGPDGPLYADLHSLRHSYVLLLDQAGVSVKQAMTLARHSDPKLTMARYGRPQLCDLASAVAKLPALATPGDMPQTLRATGTEGNFLPGKSPLAPKLAPAGDTACNRMMRPETASVGEERTQLPFETGDETSRCQLIADEKESKNEERPATVAGLFFYGEELVPGGKEETAGTGSRTGLSTGEAAPRQGPLRNMRFLSPDVIPADPAPAVLRGLLGPASLSGGETHRAGGLAQGGRFFFAAQGSTPAESSGGRDA